MLGRRKLIRLIVIGALCAAPIGCASRVRPFEFYQQRVDELTRIHQEAISSGRIDDIEWSNDGGSFAFSRDGKHFRYDLINHSIDAYENDEEATDDEARPELADPKRGAQRDAIESPDGEWIAISRDWNVVIERMDGSEIIPVTTNGTRKFRYGKASWVYGEELDQQEAMWWSPDSKRLAFYEFDERKVSDHYLTSGLTKLHTEVLVEGYPKPGEPNPIANLLIYDMESQETIRVRHDEPKWYVYSVQFRPDGAELLFNRTNRRQNVLQLMAANVETGRSRVILTESQSTWQNNRPEMQFLADGERFIWESERTEWKQYELRHIDGRSLCPLTPAKRQAASIECVVEDMNVMFYTAYSGDSPSNVHLHGVNLDGTNDRRVTDVAFNHSVDVSPNGEWFISEYSSIDTPRTISLFDTNGKHIATLSESSSHHGLVVPEMFTFTAADGVTELYGLLYKPTNFRKSRKYPLVVSVYGGPGSQRVKNHFLPRFAQCEFGFVIAVFDNRGTANRGKEFESSNYLKLGQVDLDDQVAGVKHLLQRNYIDKDRVGIYGHSYGGYMAALAIFKYPDLFHVAVAGAPVTDWRNYDTIYTERYMRTPEENADGYNAGSCLTYVDQLKGKLLIQHGMVDDNVHPTNSWRLIDALQDAGKVFDMMFYPNAAHGLSHHARDHAWQYLFQHLMN